MTELNEIFEQIFHAELKFKARTDKLKQLAQSIELYKSELLQTKEQYRTKQGELAVKNNTLADLQVEVRLLTLRKEILQEQKDSLVKSRQQITESLDEEKKRYEEDYQSFKKELVDFGCSYDLHGAGQKRRQEETKRKIELLQDELLLLKTELAEMDVQREEVQKLEKELYEAEETLEQERAKSKELKRCVLEQEAKTKKLEEECNSVGQKLSKDPEYVRLQRELECCKECPEEAECKAANRQLRELQQRCYHHQMKRQLDKQKNNVLQNKSLESGSRQPGHYNPYTCQYVPAPKPSVNSLGEMESWSQSAQGQSNSSNSSVHLRRSRRIHKEEFHEDNLKLVADEWLTTGDEEYLEEDDWDMDVLEHAIEDDVHIDSDWSSFDSPDMDTTSVQQFSNHEPTVVEKSSSKTYVHKVKVQGSTPGASQPKYLPLKPKSTTKTITGRPGPKSEFQPSIAQSHGAHNHFVQSRKVTLHSNTPVTNHEPVPQVRQSMNRASKNKVNIPSTALVAASPEPDRILRKRSGQSIYKAPGSKPTNDSLPKKVKKVRFHH